MLFKFLNESGELFKYKYDGHVAHFDKDAGKVSLVTKAPSAEKAYSNFVYQISVKYNWGISSITLDRSAVKKVEEAPKSVPEEAQQLTMEL